MVYKLKRLGTIITKDLKWDCKTSYLVRRKKTYKRLQFLHNVTKLTTLIKEQHLIGKLLKKKTKIKHH